MIYDLLTNIGNYRGMNRNLDKAIDCLLYTSDAADD